MPRKQYSTEQIITKLRQAEVELGRGLTTPQVCKTLGISEQTYYRWRKEYGGLRLDQAKRLKALERENIQLKKLVADQALDVDCGTEAIGAEVFASEGGEERVVYHTCKSRACPSCGHQATRAWQRDQWRELPDVPYAHVCLTMPDVLWPLFQRNRHLLHDLSVLGAQVLQQWARQIYGIRLMIMVIPHTFGRHMNFNCHLHILVSEGGLREDGTEWCARARL